MRIVLQRVSQAKVVVQERIVGKIGEGLVLLVGIGTNDGLDQVRTLAEKCAVLRIFDDEDGKMNRSLSDINGEVLAVSQFTLYGNTTKGRRPSFTEAAAPDIAEQLFNHFVQYLQESGINVTTGEFGARMEVTIINDGPVTFVLEA